MSYRIQVRCAVDPVADRSLRRLRARLRDIGRTLEAVSSASAFWSSMAEGPLFVDVDGWRFRYSIDATARLLLVIEASRVSEPPAADERARRRR